MNERFRPLQSGAETQDQSPTYAEAFHQEGVVGIYSKLVEGQRGAPEQVQNQEYQPITRRQAFQEYGVYGLLSRDRIDNHKRGQQERQRQAAAQQAKNERMNRKLARFG